MLVLFEFSGIVRNAFAAKGHYAVSCDLLPTEQLGNHYQRDFREVLATTAGWDIIIAHPPCTDLAVSGARWMKSKGEARVNAALDVVRQVLEFPCARIALENPISIISSRIRKPDQIVQPWMFGHGEIKATCLWLKGLPPLRPTNIVSGRVPRVHHATPGPDRWKERSRTLTGIADAMAEQWSGC